MYYILLLHKLSDLVNFSNIVAGLLKPYSFHDRSVFLLSYFLIFMKMASCNVCSVPSRTILIDCFFIILQLCISDGSF